MIGKIIGAAAGAKVAKQTSSIGGPVGAAIGAAAPFVLRKMSIPAMLIMGAAGYGIKKYMDSQEKTDTPQAKPKVAPSAT